METLNQYFERQVAQTPDATALVFKDLAISYAELNQRTNRIAAVLREQGNRAFEITPDDPANRSLFCRLDPRRSLS